MNTSTESIGQTPTKFCAWCDTEKPLTEFHKNKTKKDGVQNHCKSCMIKHLKPVHEASNKNTMYVNGQYISRKHPLFKAGRYKSFDEAAFSSLENYTRSKEGQVYIIVNEAWPEWVKIGMAVDAEDRCNGYQTGSPMRDYKLMYAVSTDDRRKAEAAAHKAAEKVAERRGEWFKMSVGQAKECIQSGL